MQYAEPCIGCGKPHGGLANRSGGGASQRYCAECGPRRGVDAQKARGEPIRAKLSALWCSGLNRREMAEQMGWTAGSVSAAISRYRAKGFGDEFPPRRRRRAAEKLKAAA